MRTVVFVLTAGLMMQNDIHGAGFFLVRTVIFVLAAGLMMHNDICGAGFSGEGCGICPNSWPDDAH